MTSYQVLTYLPILFNNTKIYISVQCLSCVLWFFFFNNGPTSASFCLLSSFQQIKNTFLQQINAKKSIQYTMLWFEPTIFRLRVSSHNHLTRAPPRAMILKSLSLSQSFLLLQLCRRCHQSSLGRCLAQTCFDAVERNFVCKCHISHRCLPTAQTPRIVTS